MPLSPEFRRHAGLLLLAAVLLFACYKAVDSGRQSTPALSREQRVAHAYARL